MAHPLLNSVVALPGGIVTRLDKALGKLDVMAEAVVGMHGEFVGMRKDITALHRSVEGLRDDVNAVNERFDTLIEQVEPIAPRIDELATGLESVQLLADRLGRFGRRRAKDAAALPAETVE